MGKHTVESDDDLIENLRGGGFGDKSDVANEIIIGVEQTGRED